MELKLVEGQYSFGRLLRPETVEGAEELKQRVRMRLSARRGAFLPRPGYGSRLHLLGQVKPSEREAAARQFVLEALAEEKELELDGLELIEGEPGQARLYLHLIYQGKYRIGLETGI